MAKAIPLPNKPVRARKPDARLAPAAPAAPARIPPTPPQVERLLARSGEGLHRLKGEDGWRTYLLRDPKVSTGFYGSLAGLCETRGWLPPAPDDMPPYQVPSPEEQSCAQRLRRSLEPRRLGIRPLLTPGEPAGWLTYDWISGAPAEEFDTLDDLAEHYGVDLPPPVKPS